MPNKDYDLRSLSDGIPHMPRKLTSRERLADHLFFYLQLASSFVVIIGAIGGYALKGVTGSILWILVGLLIGFWMRRSMGRRGRGPRGFFKRIRERANGSRRGLLEWAIETVRGSGFTVAKCQAITAAAEEAMEQCRSTSSPAQRDAILRRLDETVKRISYSE